MDLLAEVATRSMLAFSVLLFVGQFLALTLSYGSSMFNERRKAALHEANAIGTALLRAEALDHPRSREIARLIEEYGRLRREHVLAPRDASAIDEINRRVSATQMAIWGHMSGIVRERTDPLTVALMASLNEMFDAGTAGRFGSETRAPPQLFWLLIGMAVIAVGALGYQLGLKQQKAFMLATVLTAVWTAVIVVILDLSAPRFGAIRTGVAVYNWTLNSFKGGISIPQSPPSTRSN